MFDSSGFSARIYSLSVLLSFGRRISMKTLIPVEEVNPHLPKLELREHRSKDINSLNKRFSQSLSTFLSVDKQLETFNENEILLAKKPSSYSDMSTLLDKISLVDMIKPEDFMVEDGQQFPVLRTVEEPLTSRMSSRLKQIAIGKSLPEYKNYIRKVPFEERQPEDPRTPRCDSRLTKREFDHMYREWRVKLHQYGNEAISNVSTRVSSPDNLHFNCEEYANIKRINI